jgi:hypothetical protein
MTGQKPLPRIASRDPFCQYQDCSKLAVGNFPCIAGNAAGYYTIIIKNQPTLSQAPSDVPSWNHLFRPVFFMTFTLKPFHQIQN